MASRTTRPNGHQWCFCKGATGKRHTVRLGEASEDDGEEAKRFLSQLELDQRLGRQASKKTTAWLDGLSNHIHDRVAATGLVRPRPGRGKQERRRGAATITAAPGTLGYLLEAFPKSVEVKASTGVNMKRVGENLRRYFSSGRRLDEITAGDADEFNVWIVNHGRVKSTAPLARATAGRRVQESKRIFEYAVRKQWIAANPFAHLKSRCDTNRRREVYVRARLIDELIAIETDGEVRLKLALARYMGLRHDSEYRTLAWSGVDWADGYLRVESPKTEHHEGGDLRDVPIHAKVRPLLEEAWDQASEGESLVLPRLAPLSASASTDRLERLCRFVGVPLWMRCWNNLRASCETDLLREDGHDIFTVAAWMGHSPEVALRHYNRVAKDRSGRGVADLPPSYKRRASPFTSGPLGEARRAKAKQKAK